MPESAAARDTGIVRLIRRGMPGGSSPVRDAAANRASPRAEQHPDFVVGGLGEVLVPEPDRHHVLGDVEAHDLVGIGLELGERVGRPDRHREHDMPGAVGARHLQRGACGPSGRDAVVDHDDGATFERQGPVAVTEQAGPPFDLAALALLHTLDVTCVDARQRHDVLVQDAHAVLADRAHAELGLEGHAELAHDDHVERCVERASDLGGHRNSAPRQGQDHRLVIAEPLESLRNRDTRLSPVAEASGNCVGRERKLPRHGVHRSSLDTISARHLLHSPCRLAHLVGSFDRRSCFLPWRSSSEWWRLLAAWNRVGGPTSR